MSSLPVNHSSPASAGPKQLSSRLAGMKFMQRAAAAASSAAPRRTSTPSTPLSEPPSKRRRTGDYFATPGTPTSTGDLSGAGRQMDHSFIAGASQAGHEGSRITRGLNNFASDEFETEWVLDVRWPAARDFSSNTNATGETKKQSNGYAGTYLAISNDHDWSSEENNGDYGDENDIWKTPVVGRQTYGAFRKKKHKPMPEDGGRDAPSLPTKSARRNAKRRHEQDIETSVSTSRAESGRNSEVASISSASEKSERSTGSDSGSESDADEGSPADSSNESSPSSPSSSRSASPYPKSRTRSSNAFNLSEEADLKRMDAFDYNSAVNLGLGRARQGLGGQPGKGGSRSQDAGDKKRKANKKARERLAGQEFGREQRHQTYTDRVDEAGRGKRATSDKDKKKSNRNKQKKEKRKTI